MKIIKILFLVILTCVLTLVIFFYLWGVFDKIERPNFKNLDWGTYVIIGLFVLPIYILTLSTLGKELNLIFNDKP